MDGQEGLIICLAFVTQVDRNKIQVATETPSDVGPDVPQQDDAEPFGRLEGLDVLEVEVVDRSLADDEPTFEYPVLGRGGEPRFPALIEVG